MKLPAFLALAFLTTAFAHAIPNPLPDAIANPLPDAIANPLPDAIANSLADAIAESEPDADALPEAEYLTKWACKALSKSKCTVNDFTTEAKSGIYCGYCVEVIGSDWSTDDHKYYAYQLNTKTGSCCSYGFRKSCKSKYLNRSQCPI